MEEDTCVLGWLSGTKSLVPTILHTLYFLLHTLNTRRYPCQALTLLHTLVGANSAVSSP